MAKKRKKTRKELLKEPDEFLTISAKLIGLAREHQTQLAWALGAIFFLALVVSGFRLYLIRAESNASALLDRMEVIRIPGYTEDEKLNIALRYLLPKQLEAHGLNGEELQISKAVLIDIIRYYTRESGVRNLEREIATLRKEIQALVVDLADLNEASRRAEKE